MRHGTRERIILLAENARKAKNIFLTGDNTAKRLAALPYTLEGKPFDSSAVRSSRAMIKSGSSVLSFFRGNALLSIAAMLSLKHDPKALFDRCVAVYDMMEQAGLRKSSFLAVAAYLVAESTEPEEYPKTVARMKSFHDGMKARHGSCAGDDDMIFAATLAASDTDPGAGVDSIERLYLCLEPEFSAKGNALILAQILVASGASDQAAADRVLALRDAFKARNMPIGTYTLPYLGILSLLSVDVNTIVEDITEAQALIEAQKWGIAYVSKEELLLYAAAVTASGYAEDTESGLVKAAVSTSRISVIMSVQTASAAFAGAIICADVLDALDFI